MKEENLIRDNNEVYKRSLDEKWTIEELEFLMKSNKEQEEELNKASDKIWKEKETLWKKYREYKEEYNKLKYKTFKFEVKSCYYKNFDEDDGYHYDKECMIIIDQIINDQIYYRKFNIADNDGEEIFYMNKLEDNKSYLLETVIEQGYNIITEEEFNNKLKSWLEV